MESSSADREDHSGGLPDIFCRLCFEEGSPDQDLVSPCACKGSNKYIHLDCHRAWQLTAIRTENTRRAYVCSVCGSSFKPPYDACFLKQASYLSVKEGLHAAASALSSLWLPPSWMLKSVLLVAISCSLPYAILAYYGLVLTLIASTILPFTEPSVGLAPGRLLVATSRIPSTSMFHRSVVFLFEHGPQGARGVILNKRLPRASLLRDSSTLTLGADEEDEGMGGGPWSVSLGGPLDPDALIVLHNDERARWAKEVLPGVQVGTNLQELLLLTRRWDREGSTSRHPTTHHRRHHHHHHRRLPQRQHQGGQVQEEQDEDEQQQHVARVLFGFSGWGPQQLEGELRRGDWLVLEATAADVLGPTMSSEGLWRQAMQRATV